MQSAAAVAARVNQEDCKAVTEMQVASALSMNHAAIERLGHLVGRLCDRLEPLLRDEPPPKAPHEDTEVCQQWVPLATEVRGIAISIGDESDRIQGILTRMEL